MSKEPHPNPSDAHRLVIHPWEGDVFQPCHRQFRPAGERERLWPDTAPQLAEVVVVGGGLSGLAAAYALRNHRVVVLEAEPHAGGVCLAGEYAGIRYPAGSAYCYYPWDETWATFYRGLGLEVEAALVPPPASALCYRGEWYPDCYREAGIRRLPLELAVREGLLSLVADLAAWEDTWDPLGSEDFSRPELDRLSLAAYLEQERGLPPAATAILAPYCASCLGGLPHQVSAWAGLAFLMSECSSTARIMAFPEGNARLVQALAAALPEALRLGQVVVALKPDPAGVNVLAAEAASGELLCYRAATVILAVGKFVLPRLLPPGCGWEAADFRHFRYSSYVVAALQGPLEVAAPGYENWVPDEAAFSDFILTPRQGAAGREQVMVAYAPQPFPEGRPALLGRTPEAQAALILAGAERLFPGLSRKVAAVRLYRFGHAQVVPYPGFLTTLKQEGRPAPQSGRLILANADLEGLPCVEAAIIQGQKAARRAREVLRRRG